VTGCFGFSCFGVQFWHGVYYYEITIITYQFDVIVERDSAGCFVASVPALSGRSTGTARFCRDSTNLTLLIYRMFSMRSVKFTSWQDDTFFIGFLNEYPEYQTQGLTKEELIENLKDLLIDVESGQVPYIRKVEELLVA